MIDYTSPQIKVCGLTKPDEAKTCADLGANAIGLVFYPASPRNVSVEQARAITSVLPSHVSAVGVFVNPTLEMLTQTITRCRLSAVQLHGVESPDYIADLSRATDAGIIKALFTAKAPGLADAGDYTVAGYLVECGRGHLPGGNALTWNWAIAEEFARHYPLILAGGLGPENVTAAIAACLPDAVDASSGLEAGPGRKDLDKVERFIHQVHQTHALYKAHQRVVRSIL